MTKTTAKPATGSRRWRVVDIVVGALLAVAGGVLFWAWSNGIYPPLSAGLLATYPPLAGLLSGGWVLPAVLGGLIIRKPGAALFVETVAATGELLMGSQYGTTVLISGIVQGLGAEAVFAAFGYRRFTLPVAALAGVGAGLAMGLNDCFAPWGWNIAYELGDKFAYIACTCISGAVIAGLLSWLATRGLAKTGALSSFASRRAATEPVV
ncbi:ECF transporter S component [Sinomonas mesophila]|uniref:ECF transporter S component n=1 Tax=Sinomonas mesophila TaxID=1531955 RepID=UPI000984F9F3|nr:ECF transporter S component [Sinomonas mesophila]